MITEKLEQIEKDLKSLPTLMLNDYNHNNSLNLKEFLYSFFTTLNDKYDTLYKNDNSIQCYHSKHRSLGDIYLICLNYYPDLKLSELIEELIKFHEKGLLVGYICNDIDKRIYELDKNFPNWELLNQNDPDEYGLVWNDYLSLNKKQELNYQNI